MENRPILYLYSDLEMDKNIQIKISRVFPLYFTEMTTKNKTSIEVNLICFLYLVLRVFCPWKRENLTDNDRCTHGKDQYVSFELIFYLNFKFCFLKKSKFLQIKFKLLQNIVIIICWDFFIVNYFPSQMDYSQNSKTKYMFFLGDIGKFGWKY